MKILAFSDLHAANFKSFSKDIEFQGKIRNSRLVNIIESFRNMRDYAFKNKISTILFAGDMFHQRGKIDVDVYNLIHEEVRAFIKRGISIIAVAGNHDACGKYDEYSIKTFEIFDSVNEPRSRFLLLENGGKYSLGQWSIIGVGHSKNMKEIIVEKGYQKSDKYKLLLSHFLFDKAYNGNNSTMYDSNIGLKEVAYYDYCVIGDVHSAQEIGDNVLLPGEFVEHDFGAANDARGFWELDLKDDGSVKTKFIDSGGIKFYKKELKQNADVGRIRYKKDDILKLIIKSIAVDKDIIEYVKSLYENCIVEFDIPIEYVKRLDVDIKSDFKQNCLTQYIDKFGVELDKDKLRTIGERLWDKKELNK